MNKKWEKGFTLVELITVFAVIAILSGAVILYGSGSRAQIAVFQDQYKLINAFQRARFLAGEAFKRSLENDCGFGVHFDQSGDFFVFRDKKEENKEENSVSSCSDFDHDYKYKEGVDEKIPGAELFKLSPGIKFKKLDITDAVFVFPLLNLKIIQDNLFLEEGMIELGSEQSNVSAKIKINKYGQISTTE